MTDDLLNIFAITFEIGLPIASILACLLKPGSRRVLVPVLGAVTPFLVGYLYSAAGYYFGNRDEFEYGFLVMWVMSFFVYCLAVIAGILVGIFLPSRYNSFFRYAVGFVSGPFLVVMFLGLEQALA